MLTTIKKRTWGHMFHSGDSALQAPCEGGGTLWFHYFRTRCGVVGNTQACGAWFPGSNLGSWIKESLKKLILYRKKERDFLSRFSIPDNKVAIYDEYRPNQ